MWLWYIHDDRGKLPRSSILCRLEVAADDGGNADGGKYDGHAVKRAYNRGGRWPKQEKEECNDIGDDGKYRLEG